MLSKITPNTSQHCSFNLWQTTKATGLDNHLDILKVDIEQNLSDVEEVSHA